jgi:hypothetical protein
MTLEYAGALTHLGPDFCVELSTDPTQKFRNGSLSPISKSDIRELVLGATRQTAKNKH